MIRVLDSEFIKNPDGSNSHYFEVAGLSTDSKPTTGIVTGSVFLEVDTGKVYLFDEMGAEWHEVGGGSDNSGGGGE